MIRPVVKYFPNDWRQTVTIRRIKRDSMGKPTLMPAPDAEDCVLEFSYSIFEGSTISEVPRTMRRLMMLPNADIQTGDEVTVPANKWHPKMVGTVEGDPEFTPLGTAVVLRRDSATR